MRESIVIALSETKQTAGGKQYVAFVDGAGQKWTSWKQEEWALIKPGAKFDIEWEKSKDGKYKNITTMFPTGQEKPPPLPEPPINTKKQASIEMQSALDNLTQYGIAGRLSKESIASMSYEEMRVVAKLFENAGLAFREPKSQMVEAAKEMGAVEKPKKGQFPNKGAFLTKCYKELGLQRPDVEEKIGPIDNISDFDGAWIALNNSL